MSRPTPPLDDLLLLVEAAEEAYPYVTAERLSRLTRGDAAGAQLRSSLSSALKAAVTEGLLLSEERTRVTRAMQFCRVRVYRLNRRHPRVLASLES